mmetsp:Transcript_12411/g.32428  ORF Transcript_12411/g.32428 Transcript_12411/m.32428 type:complete len:277 (+) Transcript_12411:2099-2929(+)
MGSRGGASASEAGSSPSALVTSSRSASRASTAEQRLTRHDSAPARASGVAAAAYPLATLAMRARLRAAAAASPPPSSATTSGSPPRASTRARRGESTPRARARKAAARPAILARRPAWRSWARLRKRLPPAKRSARPSMKPERISVGEGAAVLPRDEAASWLTAAAPRLASSSVVNSGRSRAVETSIVARPAMVLVDCAVSSTPREATWAKMKRTMAVHAACMRLTSPRRRTTPPERCAIWWNQRRPLSRTTGTRTRACALRSPRSNGPTTEVKSS